MPDWLQDIGQVSLAAAMAVFGLVVLLPQPRTRLTLLLTGSAFLASLIVFINFYFVKLPGWPATLTGVFVWINGYSAFKHRLALQRSISHALAAREGRGRRHDD
jgi:hypothetical protein